MSKTASLGTMALRAIMNAKAKNEFRQLHEGLFVKEEELELYAFIKGHLKKHKKLPDAVTAKSHGFEMPPANEPPEYYLERLHDRGVLWAIQTRQQPLADAIAKGDMKKALAICKEQVSAAMSVNNPAEYSTLVQASKEVLRDYYVMKFSGDIPGLTTGWKTMDHDTLGLCPGDLFTFAGRPGEGKTWRLLCMARAAWLAGYSPLIASNEMMNPALVRRLLGLETGINPRAIRTGKLNFWTENKLLQCVETAKDMPPVYLLTGKNNRTVGGVERILEVLRPDAAYLDAAYLFRRPNARRQDSKSEELAENIHDIKDMAVDYAIPVCITVQFNRTIESTTGKTSKRKKDDDQMTLNSIAKSDAMGQDSDMVYGTRRCKAPYEKTRAMNVPLKIREGDNDRSEFMIHTRSAPLDFSEVTPEEHAQDEASEGEEESLSDSMI